MPSKKPTKSIIRGNSSGVALFMVLAAVAMLSVLVTEFVYIASVSREIAYGGLDQLKAHYLAKSGFKLSLLRLKAYQQVKTYLKSQGAAVEKSVPQSMVDRIWNFPFAFPIPVELLGSLGATEKTTIEKFNKNSNMDGNYNIRIESESIKYNLNSVLESYSAANDPSAKPTGTPGTPQTPGGSPSPEPTQFKAEEARKNLETYMQNILQPKLEQDVDFSANYRDLRLNELVSNIAAWADRTYEYRPLTQDKIPMKQAPFYHISELHMIPLMDDELYELFAPNFTASTTRGVNINAINQNILKALLPSLTEVEVKEFFKYRDAQDTDQKFKDAAAFYTWLKNNTASFRNDEAISKLKSDFASRRIWLNTDETTFKITVNAYSNKAHRTLLAWVTLVDPKSSGTNQNGNNPNKSNNNNNNISGNNADPNSPQGANQQNQNNPTLDVTGLRITYMELH